MQPLHSVNGWLRFLGWFNIIFGIMYAITIVGLLFAWLPIWIGICLKNAGESLQNGYPNNPSEMFRASSNLATVVKIVGVLCIINLAILALYLAFLLVVMVVAISSAAATR
jgi:hypothetical protein